jgi:hypothetical protein
MAWRSPARGSLAPCADDRHRTTPAGRFVDADRGNDAGDPWVIARVLSCRKPMDLSAHGHPRCGAGTLGTWCLVSRCPPLWMEAHPHFRSVDPAAPSQPFLTCCFAQKAGFSLPNCQTSRTEWMFAVTPSEVAEIQSPVQNVRMKWQSIIKWYRILRVHYHWPLFEAIRYALWLAR